MILSPLRFILFLALLLAAESLPSVSFAAEATAPTMATPPPPPPKPQPPRPKRRPATIEPAPVFEEPFPQAEAPPPPEPLPPPVPKHWNSFDSLDAGDRALAEEILKPMFGTDPALWPDWLDPRAVLYPLRQGNLLIVRAPFRGVCGDYHFSVFGPVREDGNRGLLGDPMCSDGLAVELRRRQTIPDLVLKSVTLLQPNDSLWHGDQIARWNGNDWLEIGRR